MHYCAACKDPEAIWDVLIENDCDASIIDKKGNPASYYLEHSSEVELPEAENMSRRKTNSGKERESFPIAYLVVLDFTSFTMIGRRISDSSGFNRVSIGTRRSLRSFN